MPKTFMVTVGGREMSIVQDDDGKFIVPEGWRGLGSALKPAMEDWWLCRKPLIGTVAENVQQHGTGALNIDGCRIHSGPSNGGGISGVSALGQSSGWNAHANRTTEIDRSMSSGRWPAHVTHDGSEEVTSQFPEQTGGGAPQRRFADKTRNAFGSFNGHECPPGIPGSSGNASRFFYCAKASGSDRGVSNKHPTVKPTALMRWLCRLITPPKGLIVDPFMGSGSTGKAAILEGFRFVGMEREPEHFEESCRRIEKAVRIATRPSQRDLFGE